MARGTVLPRVRVRLRVVGREVFAGPALERVREVDSPPAWALEFALLPIPVNPFENVTSGVIATPFAM